MIKVGWDHGVGAEAVALRPGGGVRCGGVSLDMATPVRPHTAVAEKVP